MKTTNYYVLLLLLISVLADGCKSDGSSGCWKDNGAGASYPSKNCFGSASVSTINDPAGPVINLDTLVKKIEDSLAGITGYQIAIAYNNNTVYLKSNGFARAIQQCHPMTMGSCNKCNIASVSKLITSTLTLKLLNDNGIDESAMIGSWLPDNWNTNAATDSITFRMLLSHTSSLLSKNSDFYNTLTYNGIKNCLSQGVVDTLRGRSNYLNVNYALLRIIIPKLWQARADCPAALKNLTNINEADANKYYPQAVQNLILQPAGIQGVTLFDKPDDERTLYYDASIPDGADGLDPGDWTTIAGGGGWYMSAGDLVLFMQALFNNLYVSSTIRSKMQSMTMGFWDQPVTEDGVALGHGGDVGDANTDGSGYHSKLLHFPSGLSIAVNINSDLSYSPQNSLTRVVVKAYNYARN